MGPTFAFSVTLCNNKSTERQCCQIKNALSQVCLCTYHKSGAYYISIWFIRILNIKNSNNTIDWSGDHLNICTQNLDINNDQQAKKMNVESLRSNQAQQSQSVEIRIAKAAITVCFLFVASWTPYAVLALIGAFGDQRLLTPGVTMIPALACKLVACIDPYVYAISHPRYR